MTTAVATPPDDLLTYAQAAALLGTTYGAVAAIVSRGSLPSVPQPGPGRRDRRFIPRAAVEAYAGRGRRDRQTRTRALREMREGLRANRTRVLTLADRAESAHAKALALGEAVQHIRIQLEQGRTALLELQQAQASGDATADMLATLQALVSLTISNATAVIALALPIGELQGEIASYATEFAALLRELGLNQIEARAAEKGVRHD